MAVPAWVERLRPISFVSPSGVESFPRLDLLTRVGGKKASEHEILNKDEAIPQDQGNRSIVYPVEAYFTGENGDQEADAFFKSLGEEYTVANPGILKHPQWGDIPVMPFEYQEVHNLVGEGGVWRVPVEFHSVPSSNYPTVPGVDQSEIVSDMDDLDAIIEEANATIDVDDPGRYASFRAKITEVSAIIGNSLSGIASTVDDIEDEFRRVQDDINTALSVGASAVEIMSQVNVLIRLPAQIVDTTITKVTGYAEMVQDIVNSFINDFNPNSDRITSINGSVMVQSLTAMSASATAESSLFTDFETRDAAGEALDFINLSTDASINITAVAYQALAGDIDDTFAPDHNTGLQLELINGKTNSILIDRAFDLKAKQTFILKAASDPLELTWKHYHDLDQLGFFLRTNVIIDNEHIEIAAGREIVIYA